MLQHPTGNYSNASLQGSYVYEIRGGASSNLSPYRQVGVFSADGSGNLGKPAPGSDDSSVSASGSQVTGIYQISSDGTGFITMTTSLGQITLAVTMVSHSKLYLMEADNVLDAVGVAELQDPSVIGTTPSGTFVFRLHQEVSAQGTVPASQIGAITVPSGAVNGALDQNLGGTFSSPNLTWTFDAPGSLGRGTGSFVNATTSFSTNFVYYIVTAGKVVLLVSNAGAVGSGSAEAQTGIVSSGLSGSYAFGSNGDDTNYLSGIFNTVATVGSFTASSGSISTTEDVMQDGNYSTGNTSNCYSAASNGRVTVTDCSSPTPLQIFWMVSSSRAFFLDNSPSTFEDGTADLQSTSSFMPSTIKGQFAMVMGGIDVTPELLSRIGTLQFDGTGRLTLNELANASASGGGAQSPGLLSGAYSVSSNGRITGNLSGGGLDLVMYAVSGSDAYALQIDPGTNTSGTVSLQH